MHRQCWWSVSRARRIRGGQGGICTIDKETDASWKIFVCNMKNQLWAVACGLGCEKNIWADYEQLLRPIFFRVFMGKKLIKKFLKVL